jgi:sulfide:quinone oxidoreductase
MTAYRLSESCAVSSQISPSDVSDIAAGGFTTIICNRPIPIDRNGLTMDMVEQFQKAVSESDGPVFLYCRSGQRSSVLWQASGSP